MTEDEIKTAFDKWYKENPDEHFMGFVSKIVLYKAFLGGVLYQSNFLMKNILQKQDIKPAEINFFKED